MTARSAEFYDIKYVPEIEKHSIHGIPKNIKKKATT
jgi:hypothetical protein